MTTPQTHRHRPVAIALVAFALIALAGCKDGTVPISKLLDDPSQYDHKTVRVHGSVGRSVGVLGYGGYELSDGTGSITVVTEGGGAPREGATVGVEGEFRSGFTLGTQSLAVILEKQRVAQ
jgi:hypothetical protein